MNKMKNKNIKIFFMFIIVVCTLFVGLLYFTGLFKQEEIVVGDLTILDKINDPVLNPEIPNINEVIFWLHTDKTDKISYITDVWMCGEYATTLVINAKEENWIIYRIVIYFSYYGEEGYGIKNDIGINDGHAFNMIYTKDGDDLDIELDIWYIEPQTDYMWQLDTGHYDNYVYYLGGVDETIWYASYWTNYYYYY